MILRALILITTVAVFVMRASGFKAPQRHSKSASLLSRARSPDVGVSATVNETRLHALGNTMLRPPSCIQNTGVGCISEGCAASSVTCNFGQCFCSSGCSSVAGLCSQEENVLVASGLRLKNARWPAYYMVASTLDNAISVATNSHDTKARFNLYKLPGQGKHPQDFLLVPQTSPAHSVSVVHSEHCSDLMEKTPRAEHDSEAGHPPRLPYNISLAGRSCTHSWNVQAQSMSPSFSAHPSVQETAVRFWRAPLASVDGAITIRGSGEQVDKFLLGIKGSFKVGARSGDPGLGGYWIPDPPLPFVLPAYAGPACEYDCGSASVRSAVLGHGALLTLLIALRM